MPVPDNSAYQIVLNTCPDAQTAQTLAEALVQERLAACVNILPLGRSIYLWKGEMQQDNEHLLVIKSVRANFAGICQRLRALHPYELPEIIAVPIIDGLPEYLNWLRNPDQTL